MAVDVEASSAAIPTESESRSATGGDLLMLMEKSQLQRLALLLRNNEEPLMRRVVASEQERVEYLRTVTDSYDHSMQLLDDCTALRDAYSGSARSGAARDVHDYVLYGLNLCMQNIRNSCMRVDALGKLRAHYDALAGHLADADADAESLAAEAAEYKASMWEYSYKHRSASGRALSRAYSQVLKMEGVGFPELLRRHQVKLGYGKLDFEDLGDTEKLDVYNSIIDESGRAQILFPVARGKGEGKKIAAATWKEAANVFITAAGNMVWDIFTAEHQLEAVLRGSLNVMAAVGAFAVEVAVTAAVTKAVAKAGLGLFATSLAGFVVGAVAGLIFVTVSGRLIDLIFGTGVKVPQVSELKFHTAVMPDGMDLANAIAH